MKPLSFLLILIAGCLLCPDRILAQDVTPSDRVTTHVNVREASDASSPAVGQLKPGDSAELIERLPRWYQVRLPDDTEGYVLKAWAVVASHLEPRSVDELRIHAIAVGAGNCVIVECPGESARPMIVDCGTVGVGDTGLAREEVRDYIHEVFSGHSGAYDVVLSHGHTDHYGYIPFILDDPGVASIWLGGALDDYGARGFPEWFEEMRESGASIQMGRESGWHNEGSPLQGELECGDASVFPLTVNDGEGPNPNSLVLMIEYKDFTYVLPGDAEGVTENQILANYADGLKASVLLSPHHGAASHGSNSQEWIDALSPEAVIFSAGDRFGHPHCEAVHRYSETVAQTRTHPARCGDSGIYQEFDTVSAKYATATNGTIVVTTTGEMHFSIFCSGSSGCGVTIPF